MAGPPTDPEAQIDLSPFRVVVKLEVPGYWLADYKIYQTQKSYRALHSVKSEVEKWFPIWEAEFDDIIAADDSRQWVKHFTLIQRWSTGIGTPQLIWEGTGTLYYEDHRGPIGIPVSDPEMPWPYVVSGEPPEAKPDGRYEDWFSSSHWNNRGFEITDVYRPGDGGGDPA